MDGVRLIEGLPDRGRHNCELAFGDMRQVIAHPVNPAPLPGRREHPRDGGLEAVRRERRKSVQKVSASEGPMPRPMISRRLSVLAAMAVMAATGTIRTPWRCLR